MRSDIMRSQLALPGEGFIANLADAAQLSSFSNKLLMQGISHDIDGI